MLNTKVETALNKQLNAELESSYIYLAMAAHFHAENFNGFAHWMIEQAKEELGHVKRFYDFICQRRGKVTLDALAKPPASWKSPLAVFENALEQEQGITKKIDDLVALSIAEKDNATLAFLQWFINEQVEEEALVDAVIQKLQMVKDAPAGLLLMDRELSAR